MRHMAGSAGGSASMGVATLPLRPFGAVTPHVSEVMWTWTAALATTAQPRQARGGRAAGAQPTLSRAAAVGRCGRTRLPRARGPAELRLAAWWRWAQARTS